MRSVWICCRALFVGLTLLCASVGFAEESPTPKPLPTPPVKGQVKPVRAAKGKVKPRRVKSKPISGPKMIAKKKALKAFIHAHTLRVQAEDLKGYLADIIPKHPDINAIHDHAVKTFSDYDLTIKVESIKVAHLRRKSAKVKVVQQTTRTAQSSGAQTTERAQLIYHLKQIKDRWHIVNTNRERLDDEIGETP